MRLDRKTVMSEIYVSAAEAVRLLDIKKDTLYAYVSRGLLQSVSVPGKRAKQYLREDIERLQQRKRLRQQPETEVKQALYWGMPLMNTRISHIREGQLYYRDQSLSQVLEGDLETLIALLWGCEPDIFEEVPAAPDYPALLKVLPPHARWREKLQLCLVAWGAEDLKLEKRESSFLPHAVYLLHRVWSSVAPLCGREQSLKGEPSSKAWSGWLDYFLPVLRSPVQQQLAQLLLVLAAEHELNISSFTARCIASARGNGYAALTGALAALSGQRHGGQVLDVSDLLLLSDQRGTEAALQHILRQRGRLPLGNHPLYPDGDPRWTCFEVRARELVSSDEKLASQFQRDMHTLTRAVEIQGATPTLDWVLAIGSRLLCPELDALDWFALGRTVGWLAHMTEQYTSPHLIRPRGEI